METKPIFYEEQQFRQWWVWAILIGVSITTIVISLIADDNGAQISIVLLLAPMLLIGLWFWKAALITRIEQDGIYVKFRYFHKDFKFYPWDTIRYCEVKKYNPTMDYGGWGIKPGAYNVSGNMGMLIQFNRRDNLMIGTNKPDELKTALSNLGKLK